MLGEGETRSSKSEEGHNRRVFLISARVNRKSIRRTCHGQLLSVLSAEFTAPHLFSAGIAETRGKYRQETSRVSVFTSYSTNCCTLPKEPLMAPVT